MAKTKTKTKAKPFTIRTVGTKEERKRPSVFMRLKADEAFKGVALFEPDPELDDNPGYFEYYDHYDKSGNAYVPCVGEKCPFCAVNDNPSTRAATVWYFPQAADVKDRIKVFTMNYSTTQEISDESEDEGGIIGKVIRIKRLNDKGDYRVKVTTDKALTKKELKEAMKLLSERFPQGLVALIEKQLQVQLERLKAVEAMDDDDDDDDEETTTKARRGRSKDEDDEDDDDDDDDEDDDDTTAEADEDEDDEDDDEDEEDEADEADEDDDEEDEADGDDEDDGEVTSIEGVEYEVTKVDESEEVIHLKNDDEKIKMWLGSGVDPDYSEVKKGATVVVDAAVDDDGDWVITALSVKKPKGGKKTSDKKKK